MQLIVNENSPLTADEFQEFIESINTWFNEQLANNPILASVEEDLDFSLYEKTE